VLEKEIIEINSIDDDNELWFNDYEYSINIYELQHSCKEWAYERDFYIYSIFTFAGEGACYVIKDDEIQKRLATFTGDSEPAAVFAATQWLLDNKDKQ